MGEFHVPKKFRIAFNLTSKAKWYGDKDGKLHIITKGSKK